jgi:phosphatidylglycerophosphatase A
LSRWTYWIATGLGLGRIPLAPGTAGSAGGLAIVLWMRPLSPLTQAALVLILVSLGWYCAGREEQATGQKDNPQIVIDEIAGMMISAMWIPSGWGPLFLAFLLFRALDILKPAPAGWVERTVPGGGGIMLDDVVAGAYTHLILMSIGKMIGW